MAPARSGAAATRPAAPSARSLGMNPRVLRGLARQADRRRAAIDRGERHIGWKSGMGGASAMAALGTTGALTGYLTDATLLPADAIVDVRGWAAPVLEPEIAIRLGTDLAPGATRKEAALAIDALASAIEIADVDLPLEDPEEILAGNVFHRGLVLGPFDVGRARADVAGVSLSVVGRHRRYADGVHPTDAIGDLADVACHVADVLAYAGHTLSAGDVVITGAALPVPLNADERIEVVHWGLGEVAIQIAA